MELKKLIDQLIDEEKKEGTFKCPDCGSKVLKNTAYCLKCKKKVHDDSEGEGDAQ